MRIAVDLMGGDLGPAELLPAILRARENWPDTTLTLIGDPEILGPVGRDVAGCDVIGTTDVVAMNEAPARALRRGQESSMYRAIAVVAAGEADGCLSPGNTGALMAIARHVLRTVPGVDRPAIIKAIPSVHGRCYLLDLGANLNCSSDQLVQFAAMGSVMCQALDKIEAPRVGLLNIGQEESKGEEAVREAAAILREIDAINFIGFVEGDGIYQSDADVLVCDGWVGNVALKTSEGLARFVAHLIREAFSKDVASRAAAFFADPILKRLREDLSPENYNGATLLGLNGTVVKSHGSADANGFFHALGETRRCIEQGLPGLLGEKIERLTGDQPR